MILSGALLVLFALPLCRGVWNAGIGAGMALCAFILFLTASPAAHAVLRALTKSAPGRALLALAALLALTAAALLLATGLCIRSGLAAKPADGASVIVLGCQVNGTAPSLTLAQRLNAAAAYLKEHPDAACVVSGGRGTGEDITEAACMETYLLAAGIEPERICKEERSTDTVENLTYSLEILRENGLSTDLAIATSGYHEYRALRQARRLGCNAGAVPARTSAWLLPGYVLREQMAIVRDWLRGR